MQPFLKIGDFKIYISYGKESGFVSKTDYNCIAPKAIYFIILWAMKVNLAYANLMVLWCLNFKCFPK